MTRLVLKADRNTVAAGIRRVLDHLTPGIDPARIMIVGPKDRFANMADYRMIDLALDTTPVAGPLTLWESLWMGVPVIALRGTTQSARASMSILTATGIPQFIADDTEVYLRIVLDLVRDPGPLSALRRDLRGWLEASPAGNPERIAAAMSEAFRAIWRRSCASPH
jgi:predicted O-linked N-acetylglucosamine transferase (SPINDLY family)